MQRSRIASAAVSILVLLPSCSLLIDTNPDGVIAKKGTAGQAGNEAGGNSGRGGSGDAGGMGSNGGAAGAGTAASAGAAANGIAGSNPGAAGASASGGGVTAPAGGAGMSGAAGAIAIGGATGIGTGGSPTAGAAGAFQAVGAASSTGGSGNYCALASDCNGICQTCADHTCIAVVDEDDLDSCAGTCDAAGACKSKQGQLCQATSGGCLTGTTCAPDGYCCNSACADSCMACDVSGFLGICTPVASGIPHGNRTACSGTSTVCGGTCSGRSDGQCSYPTVNCGAGPTCSSTNYVGQSTCSSGSCTTPAAKACDGNLICSTNACKLTCASDTDCLSSSFCGGGSCHLKATAVTAAGNHSCAILFDGTVRCWGNNSNGELGTGTINVPTVSTTPVAVGGLPGLGRAISAGNWGHTCASMADQTIWCWGSNVYGQLGNGTTDTSAVPVRVSGIGQPSSISALGSGSGHTCAVDRGLLLCWGLNGEGQLGSGTATTMAPTGILTPIGVSGLSPTNPVTFVAGGTGHTCEIPSWGSSIYCWGSNSNYQLGITSIPTTSYSAAPLEVALSGLAISVAGGTAHTCAVISDGSVLCWGDAANGQTGDSAAPGPYYRTIPPKTVSGLPAAALTVSAGSAHTCALLSDRTVWCWGLNSTRQLGNSLVSDLASVSPVQVSNLSTVTSIAVGNSYGCALLANGSVWCWGNNLSGELGDGSQTNRAAPVQVVGW